MFPSFHWVDRDLQKYRHLQVVIDISLRRTVDEMESKIL